MVKKQKKGTSNDHHSQTKYKCRDRKWAWCGNRFVALHDYYGIGVPLRKAAISFIDGVLASVGVIVGGGVVIGTMNVRSPIPILIMDTILAMKKAIPTRSNNSPNTSGSHFLIVIRATPPV